MTPNPARILVTVLDNLGDAVMATAVLRPLKKIFPRASVGVFVKSYVAEILTDHSMVDRVHAADPFWDRSPVRGRGPFADFAETIYDIRRERYDVAFVLNTEWRRAGALWVAGVPVRVGFDRRSARPLLTTAVADSGAGSHFVDAHRALIRAFAGDRVDAEEFVPRLEVSDRDRAWWETWSPRAGMPAGGYTVIHPFSGDERKNWPLGAWASLIERLEPRGHRFVIVASAAEKGRLDQALRAVPSESIHVMAGAALRHVKAVISRARLLIGGDSGPAHMASALGVPVLSLFGPGTPARSGPLGRAPVRFITHHPLAALDVSEVEAAAAEMLESGAAR